MPGLWFEEFEIGKVYRHSITRTVTEMDNMMFSCLTMNRSPSISTGILPPRPNGASR